MSDNQVVSQRYFILVGIILLGCFLRLHQINRVSLRGDEVFTVLHWMREPLSGTLANIATVDPQPPLAYALYRAYALLVGSQEYGARFLPALGNLLGIPALYCLGARLLGRRAGLLAALLWAVHPFEIWHAQDARSYALWAAASVTALAAALQALRRDRGRCWLLYIAFALIAAYLYYLELFITVALNLFVLVAYWRRWRLLWHWGLSQLAIGLLLAVWFLQPRLLVSSGYGGTAGTVEPLRLLTWFIPTLTFGDTYPPALLAALGIFSLALFVLSGLLLWQHRQRHAVMLLTLLGTLPLLLIALVSLRLAVFTPRYVLAVAPAYMLLLAALCSMLWQRHRRFAAAGLFVGLLAFDGYGLNNYFLSNDYAKSKDWRALTEFIDAHSSSDDIVINAAGDIAYSFYHDETGAQSQALYLPASNRQSDDEIIHILTTRTQDAEAVWIVADTPTAWHNRDLVDQWLDAHMQRVWDTSVAGLRAQEYRQWQVSAAELAAAQPAPAFSTFATLSGYRTFLDTEQDTLLVWLYWRPQAAADASLKVFVHLIGTAPNPQTGSPLWSQDDQLPQDGRIDSRTWPTDTPFRDVYLLPLHGVPSGTYTLEVGMYDPVTQERSPLLNGGDALQLMQITLK